MTNPRAVVVVGCASFAAVAAWALARSGARVSGDRRLFVLDDAPPPTPATRTRGACCASGARNGNGRRSRWRSPLGLTKPWASWVYELAGRNGVYLVRPLSGGDLLYIGESHRQRLMKTLTRHLWGWSGEGSGPTYNPRHVEIAIELIDDPEDAIKRQFELIRRLEPRDNVLDGHSLLREPGSDDDAPTDAGDSAADVPF